jgi:hypothetical protein
VITFRFDDAAMRDGVDADQWPSLERDLKTTWIVFDGQISAGNDAGCALLLPDCELPQAAHIRFKGGYWISPAQGTELTLGGDAAFYRETPIPAQAELALAGSLLTVREAAKDDAGSSISQSPSNFAARGDAR